jgi:hypothetical protein
MDNMKSLALNYVASLIVENPKLEHDLEELELMCDNYKEFDKTYRISLVCSGNKIESIIEIHDYFISSSDGSEYKHPNYHELDLKTKFNLVHQMMTSELIKNDMDRVMRQVKQIIEQEDINIQRRAALNVRNRR